MKIAIVRLSSLGDIAQTMVVIQFIKRDYPNSIIDWYVDSDFIEIVKSNPHINNVYPVSLRSIKKKKYNIKNFLKQLLSFKNNSYDILIDYQGLLKSALVSRFIKAKKKVGYSSGSCREPLASLFYNCRFEIPYEENVYLRYTKLTSMALDIEINYKSLENKKKYIFTQSNITNSRSKKIGISIGASKKEKIYSIEKYVELTNKLNESFILFWGNETEKSLAQKIQSLSNNNKVFISEKLDLKHLIQQINNLKVLIGSDTGPLHIAWACKIPSLVLFGPTSSKRVFYPSPINKAIDVNLDKRLGYKSLQDIEVNHIIGILKKIGGEL